MQVQRISNNNNYNTNFRALRIKSSAGKQISRSGLQKTTSMVRNGLIAAAFALMIPLTNSCSNEKRNDVHWIHGNTIGRVQNRNYSEINRLTSLYPTEFNVAKQLMLDEMNYQHAKKYGQIYFKDTEYRPHEIYDNKEQEFLINFTNSKQEFKFVGKLEDKSSNFIMNDSTQMKVQRKYNGEFMITLQGWHGDNGKETRTYNFTRNGELKDKDVPEYMSSFLPKPKPKEEQVVKEEKQVAKGSSTNDIRNVDEDKIYTDIKDINLFKNNNKTNIAKFINILGLKNVEYVNKKGGNIFFMDGYNCSYKLNIRTINGDADTFIGVANKVTSDNRSEIYLIKAEMFSTNKSDKLILSKMRVVQDGLEEYAPTYKKNIKETLKIGGNTSSTKNNVNLSSKQDYAIVQLFKNFGDWRKFYEGNISSQVVNNINEIITEVNSDGKKVKIISIDKATGQVTVQGE